MKRALWIIGLSLSALASVALTGLVGLVSSAGLIMAPPEGARTARADTAPPPLHDPTKQTVAVLLGDTRTEATDFLAPYSMFAEAGGYNVYAVASSRAARTLAGGVDVIPQLTFAELAQRVPDGPDVIVVPAITAIKSPANAPVLDWIRRNREGATLFSWCMGAEVLAATGLIDGRPATAHWGDIDGLEGAYRAVEWRRGLRYVDDGDLLTTGGITSGVDATLHFLATRTGQAVADRVAEAMHYPDSPYIQDPRAPQYTTQPVDAAVYFNLAFNWPKSTAAIWLYDGVGEVDLAAAVEVFGVTSADATTTVAASSTVTSQHGLQFVPRRETGEGRSVDRVLVPGGTGVRVAAAQIPADLLSPARQATILENEASPTYAFTLALEELAASHDVIIAKYAARQLEVRSALSLVGPAWPLQLLVVPLLAALSGCVLLTAAVRLGQRIRRSPAQSGASR